MCVGLEIDSRSVGYHLCESDSEGAFTEDDLRLLKIIAETAALVDIEVRKHWPARFLLTATGAA